MGHAPNMRMTEAVRTFEEARLKARLSSTWHLKLWAYLLRRRLEFERTDRNLLRKIAVQGELNERLRASVRQERGPERRSGLREGPRRYDVRDRHHGTVNTSSGPTSTGPLNASYSPSG